MKQLKIVLRENGSLECDPDFDRRADHEDADALFDQLKEKLADIGIELSSVCEIGGGGGTTNSLSTRAEATEIGEATTEGQKGSKT